MILLLMMSKQRHDMLIDWQAQEQSQAARSSQFMARLANAQQESQGLQAQLSGSQSVELTLQGDLANLTAKLTDANMSRQDLQLQLTGVTAQLSRSQAKELNISSQQSEHIAMLVAARQAAQAAQQQLESVQIRLSSSQQQQHESIQQCENLTARLSELELST